VGRRGYIVSIFFSCVRCTLVNMMSEESGESRVLGASERPPFISITRLSRDLLS
jgi:hypothetical protein